ncbi:MAG: hypothetical protein AB7P69_07630 [Candidatus Binatia bacterium]
MQKVACFIILAMGVLGLAGGVRADEIDLSTLSRVLRAAEIDLGPSPDLGEEAPGYLNHPALNMIGQSPPNLAWLALSNSALYGAGTACVSHMDSVVNGEQCAGPVLLAGEGSAVFAESCEGKGTDTLRIGVVDLSTGVYSYLKSFSLNGQINTYGGSNPPSNCDQFTGPGVYHMYCQWVQTCLSVEPHPDGTLTLTATAALHGSGLLNDQSRNDPTAPLTELGRTSWSGPSPTGVATGAGNVGVISTATLQSVLQNSFFSPMIVDAVSASPPPPNCP